MNLFNDEDMPIKDARKLLLESSLPLYRNFASHYKKCYDIFFSTCDNQQLREVLSIIYAARYFYHITSFLITTPLPKISPKYDEFICNELGRSVLREKTSDYILIYCDMFAKADSYAARQWVENSEKRKQMSIEEYARHYHVPQEYLQAAQDAVEKDD